MLLATVIAASCSNDPEQNQGPSKPLISIDNRPEHIKLSNAANVSVTVDPRGGTIAEGGVKLTWGPDNTVVVMTPGTAENQYDGSFTPSKVGTYTYKITATATNGQTGESQSVTLTVSENGPADGDPAEKLRLSEIGTAEGKKFIELYNPTNLKITLEDFSIRKNGETDVLFHSFTAADFVGASNYGVLFAKGTTAATGTFQNLGTAESGLSGSKALFIELLYKGQVIDAFSNTRNPDVTNAEWDEEPEAESVNFIRKNNAAGWFATKDAATPGKANGTAGTRLRHQYYKADAVADGAYLHAIHFNPASAEPTGITAGSGNLITVEAFSDAFSAISSVKIFVNGAETPMTLTGDDTFTYQASPSFSGNSATVKIEIENDIATDKKEFEVKIYPGGTAFGSPTEIRLNEIATKSDWIEIYNPSSKPVAIGGMRIRKNKDRIFTIPSHMTLDAGGFGILKFKVTDPSSYTDPGSSYLLLGAVTNGLSGSKSLLIELRRRKVDGEDNSTNIDSFVNITTTDKAPNKDSAWDVEGAAAIEYEITASAGRKPDGSGDWYTFESSNTKGSSNAGSTTDKKFTQKYHQTPGE